MVLAAKLIDTNALLNVLWVSFVAGVGSTAVFSIAIAGATRFVEMRREGRSVEAGFYAALGGLALGACLGAMALGIFVIVNKEVNKEAARISSAPVKIFVTGASGFVGRVTCEELTRRGHEVIAAVRRPGSEPPGTQAQVCDLTDAASLQEAVPSRRPDAVIHLAAEIASQRDAAKIREVNVEGTRRLLEACLAGRSPGGAPRFVLASTVVTGDAHGQLLEPDKPLPVETPYGESKQEAEQLVLESGLDAVIVRPSHVYGPGGWYADEFVKRLRQPGRFAVIGSGDNWWDVVRVEDVATALADAAERAPAGAVYHVADDQPIKFYDFVALTARALGVGSPRRIPVWLANLAAGRNAVRAAVRSARSSNARIKEELGWRPEYPSAAVGVPDAVAKLL